MADFSFVSHSRLDLANLIQDFSQAHTGAIVLFSGEVRNSHLGKDVLYLEYEALEPLANKMIQAIIDEAFLKWDLHKVRCVHRIGKVDCGESAVVIITSSAHRNEAYQANRYLIDNIKSRVPIWKKEFFTDGTHTWGKSN